MAGSLFSWEPWEPWGPFLLRAGWQGAILALVVATVCWMADKRITARWQFVLWGLVFVRLACPILPPSLFSVANVDLGFAWEDSEEAFAIPDTIPPTDLGTPARPMAWELAKPMVHEEKPPTPSEDIVDEPQASHSLPPLAGTMDWENNPQDPPGNPGMSWIGPMAFCIWASIAGILLARLWWRSRRLRKMVLAWRAAMDPEVLMAKEECRRRCGIRRSVRIVQSIEGIGPATRGVFRPSIVVPASLIQSLTLDELRMVFLHEMSHVRRLDILWDQLASILAAFHWFNPAAWWSLRQLRSSRELACDAAVLGFLAPHQVKPYGHLIVNLAARQSHNSPRTVLIGAAGSARLLHRRIEMIATYRKSTWKHTLLGAFVLSALVLCGLTSAEMPKASESVDSANAGQDPQLPGDTKSVISGTCVDEERRPLENVRVRLFRADSVSLTRELVKDIQTDAAGKFRFENLPAPVLQGRNRSEIDEVYYKTYYVLAITKPGRASRVNGFLSSAESTRDLLIALPKSGTLSGRVTDEEGRPIPGAKVFLPGYPSGEAMDDVLSATTDVEGKYAIGDLTLWDADNVKPQKVGEGTFAVTTHCYFSVLHPNYGLGRPSYHKVPSTVDVTLKPAAVIEGQVIDQVTGKPATASAVSMQGIGPTDGYQETKTDDEGRYRFSSVAAGRYNLWADADERTCIAIDSLDVEAGKTYANEDIPLVEGGWIEGRIVDAKTGEPISEADGLRLRLASYGPARPKSGAAVVSAPVRKDGRFGLRVAPGTNFPYIMTSEIWKRTEDAEKIRAGIQVADGELVVLDLRVLSEAPRKKPPYSPVRLSVPVAEEREAAASIRRLGGWYTLDDDKHVVEVNMVDHETEDKVRYDNGQEDTDEALQWIPKFPKLNRLFLKEGQATDEGLRHVAELSDLETFFAWDAPHLTDAGVEHLAKLRKLRRIHINGSQIGDGALKVFGGLKNLEDLSLQGNQFTDGGIPHLSHLKSLKSLWIGLSQTKLSEVMVPHLSRLENLEELDLQQIPLTDQGVKELKSLTKIRQLYLYGSPDADLTITDTSADVLANFKQLENLGIQNCRMTDDAVRQLAALPKLKSISLEGTEVTPKTKADLEQRYPEIRFNIPLKSK